MLLRRLALFAFTLTPFLANGQINHDPSLLSGEEQLRRAEQRALAEELVAGKESPGRELGPRLRHLLIDSLSRESAAQLRERLASGNIATAALGDTQSELVYTRLAQPCRIIDTRIGGGPLTPGSARNFKVAGTTGFTSQGGNSSGCGVPVGDATAAMINFVAVNPAGAGNLRGAAYPEDVPPIGSIINYQLLNPNLNIANGVAFPICDPVTAPDCDSDITVEPNGSGVHLVADVLGYFGRFPLEKVRTFTVQDASTGVGPSLPTDPACVNFAGLSVTVTAPVAGKVLVRASVKVSVTHTAGEYGSGSIVLSTNTIECHTGSNSNDRNYLYLGGWATGTYQYDVPLEYIFDIAQGATTTYYVNGQKTPVDSDTYTLYWGRLSAQFIPD